MSNEVWEGLVGIHSSISCSSETIEVETDLVNSHTLPIDEEICGGEIFDKLLKMICRNWYGASIYNWCKLSIAYLVEKLRVLTVLIKGKILRERSLGMKDDGPGRRLKRP